MSLAGPLMPELAGRVADAFEGEVRAQEERWLSPLAVRSYETRGRLRSEDDCSLRTPFQRDRDRTLHSKPFRRLKGKTQVFIDPAGAHYRTRMPHTLETTGTPGGGRGSPRTATLVHDPAESPQRAGDIVQSAEIGGAMLALRAFMFERVYLGPHTRHEQERARATVRRIFEHLAERGDEPEQIVEFIAGMTDRFALSYVAELS